MIILTMTIYYHGTMIHILKNVYCYGIFQTTCNVFMIVKNCNRFGVAKKILLHNLHEALLKSPITNLDFFVHSSKTTTINL